MKKIAFAIVVSFLAVSMLFGIQGSKVSSRADFPLVTGVAISSPTNKTYTSGFQTLKVTSPGLGASNIHTSMNYSLDGIYNDTIPVAVQSRENSFQVLYVGTVDLPELSLGSHWLTVYWECSIENAYANGVLIPKDTRSGNTTVHFTISDTIPAEETIPPLISNLSVKNKTYSSNDFSELSFSIDKAVSWTGYCLDNQKNATIGGWYDPASGNQLNATLTALKDLSEGSHSLVIYANSAAGYTGASETVYFTIESSPALAPSLTPQESPLLTPKPSSKLVEKPVDSQTTFYSTLAIAVVIAMAAVFALLVKRYANSSHLAESLLRKESRKDELDK